MELYVCIQANHFTKHPWGISVPTSEFIESPSMKYEDEEDELTKPKWYKQPSNTYQPIAFLICTYYRLKTWNNEAGWNTHTHTQKRGGMEWKNRVETQGASECNYRFEVFFVFKGNWVCLWTSQNACVWMGERERKKWIRRKGKNTTKNLFIFVFIAKL